MFNIKLKKMAHSKTKIICTIGPASSSVENLIKLIDCGMDIARLNFSHGTYDQHKETISNIRSACDIVGKQIAILQDLQGPKIRIGKFDNDFAELENGQEFKITTDKNQLGNSECVSTNYSHIVLDVKPGNTLLLDDGYIILKVKRVSSNEIITVVEKGGKLKSNKGIICQGSSFSAPAMSEKDVEDLRFGLSCDIDAVALSYVRSVRDILELKTAMKIFGKQVGVVAKIERPEALDHVDEIISECDSIMIARGDLGLEMPPELVPIIQKDIIVKCNNQGKPVITATQMLESMISNPRPTRAEASDVANAVYDGTDCVMLSGETSVGTYPFEAVQYMNIITKTVEDHILEQGDKYFAHIQYNDDVYDALGRASVLLAEQISAKAIVTLTTNTQTAKSIAKYRPKIPIIGLTNNVNTYRRLNFVWGCEPSFMVNFDIENHSEYISEHLLKHKLLEAGDRVVVVYGENQEDAHNREMIRLYQI